MDDWRELLHNLRNPDHELGIAVVGKYAEHRDAYKSIYEALDHAGIAHRRRFASNASKAKKWNATDRNDCWPATTGCSSPGGFGERGIEGKVEAIRFARERGIPFFGICLGMQCAAVEFARNVVGLAGAHSTEMAKDTPHPVICLLDEQKAITDKGGTMRLGSQEAVLEAESQAAGPTAGLRIFERHRHRYEFNNVYRNQFAAHGMSFAGLSPDGSLVELMELPSHPWFLAVQFHPEFKSKPTAAHPLFAGFIGAALARHAQRERALARGRDAVSGGTYRAPAAGCEAADAGRAVVAAGCPSLP